MTQLVQATSFAYQVPEQLHAKPLALTVPPPATTTNTAVSELDEYSSVPLLPLPTLRALDLEACAEAISNLGRLTVRERYVLVPMLRGCQNDEIVRLTGISRRGVKFHVSNILRKLRITQRSELLRFFF